MSIIIGADIVPTEKNIEYFINGEVGNVFDEEILEILRNADYRIFNLEVPLCDFENPIKKSGPNLIAPTGVITGLKKLEIDLFTLANNHILDQGVQGLKTTIHLLENNNISYVGVGENKESAAKPFFFNCMNRRIGVYACAEYEFSVVTSEHMGANAFDLIDTFEHIENCKRNCDYLIVLYHGGIEEYRYPSPLLQKVFRKMADNGADLVIAQHTHCIGCWEKYKNSSLVYGQGNFSFDKKDNEYWNTGLLIEIKDDFSIEFIPFFKENRHVKLAKELMYEKIMGEFHIRCREVLDNTIITEKYNQLVKTKSINVLLSLSGLRYNIPLRVMIKLFGNRFGMAYFRFRYRKRRFFSLKNLVECEAHSEMLRSLLSNWENF